MKLNPIALAILAALSQSTALASTALKPVEVIGTSSTHDSQTLVITKQDLANTGNSETGNLLKQLPGVNAARKGGHGLDPQIRGQQQDQLNVFLDGAKIEAGCPNRMDPATSYTEINSYDELEVIYGVKSLEYGAGGTGGTLLFKRNKPTYNPNKMLAGEITAGKSNVINYETNAQIEAVGKTGYVVIQGSKKDANNYTDGNGKVIRSSYNTQQGHIDLGWTPNDHHHLKLSAEKSRTEDALYAGAMMDSPESEGTMLRLQYEGRKLSEAIEAMDVSLYHSSVDHVMDNYSLRPNMGMKMATPTTTETQGAKVKFTTLVATTQFEYGIQLESVNQDATLWNKGTQKTVNFMWPDVTKTTKSVFGQSNTALTKTSNLILGVRYDDVDSTANKAHKVPQMPPTNTPTNLYSSVYSNYKNETSANDQNLNGLIRFEQKMANHLNWYAGLSHTKRSANATERFMAKGPNNASAWVGNPNLKPEEHTQMDLGLGQKSTRLSWNAAIWYDTIHNYILRDMAKNQTKNGVKSTALGDVYVNVDAELYGADFDANYAFNNAFELGGNISLTKGRNTTDNRNIALISAPKGALFASYTQNDFNLGSRVNFALEQTDIDTQYTNELKHGKTPAWSTLDVFSGYQMSKNWHLSAGVDNVFDHAYYDHLSYDINQADVIKFNEPGRNYWAKVTAKF